MARTRYRHGRKDHNKRVQQHQEDRVAKGIAAIKADRLRVAELHRNQHEPLIPYSLDAING